MPYAPTKTARAWLVAVGLMMASGREARAIPLQMTYMGRMTEANGKPVEGPVDLDVTFYRSESGGEPISGINPLSFSAVKVKDGVFQIVLNLSPGDFHIIFNDSRAPVFIEVTDATHQRVYPRQSFSMVPYALKVPVDAKTLGYNTKGELTIPSLAGGADGQVLTRSGESFTWTTPSGGGSGNVPAPPAINGQVLTSTAAGAMAWAVPPSAPVSSVNGQTGAVNVTAAGLSAVAASEKGANNGVATLNGSGKVVQDPASASTTPGAFQIPLASAGGTIALGWLPNTLTGKDAATVGGIAPSAIVQGGANVGSAGVDVYKGKNGSDLEFKKLNAASSKISVTDDAGNNKIDLNVNEANLNLANLGGTLNASQVPAMVGANGTTAGQAGAVPTPAATDNGKFLRGDGTWQNISGGSASYGAHASAPANSVYVANDGKVGVGTATPAANLTVGGTPAASATSSLLQIGDNPIGFSMDSASGTYLGLNMPAASTSDVLNFEKNGASYMRMDTSGNFFLMQSGSATYSMAVIDGDIRFLSGVTGFGVHDYVSIKPGIASSSGQNTGLLVNPTDATSGTSGFDALRVNVVGAGTGSGEKTLLRLQSDDADKVVVDRSGHVGIGTSSPAYSLDVNGSAKIGGHLKTHANMMQIMNDNANSYTAIGLVPNGTSTLSIINLYNGSDTNNSGVMQVSGRGDTVYPSIQLSKTGTGSIPDFMIRSGASNYLFFGEAATGNVGIGTITPAAKLEVAGQVVSKMPTAMVPAGTTQTIDFAKGNFQSLDLGSASGDVTLAFSNAVAGGSYGLKITQGATARIVTWPASVKWPNGTPLSLSTANGAVDIVTLMYDGTNFYAVGGNNFQ